MGDQRQCATCGRQFEDTYQFCPFDATPLVRQCPTCGKIWDAAFQFCPLDSTALATPPRPEAAPAASAVPPPPAPTPAPSAAAIQPPPVPAFSPAPATVRVTPPAVAAAPASQPAVAPPPRPSVAPAAPPALQRPYVPAAQPAPEAAGAYAPKPTQFTFADQVAKPSAKTVLLRPMSIFLICGVAVIFFFVWYLTIRTSGPDLPLPAVSYTLLPNEGKTKGVPVAIKVNQLTVFLIDDPMDSSQGATRAKQVVTTLDDTFKPMKTETTGIRFAVDTVNGHPAVLKVNQDGSEPHTLLSVTDGDAVLAGDMTAQKLAEQEAERLTDVVKVYILGEAPNFSTETDFGKALLAMYNSALAANHNRLTKRGLDQAFTQLTEAQRQALESPPKARRTSARLR